MTPFAAVLLYVAWMLLLALIYAGPRLPLGLSGAKPIDSWERGKTEVDPPILQRTKAAHMNCVENFPLFAGVVVIAALMDQLAVVSGVAAFVLYARVAQSVVHISGVSLVQVLMRATFFLIQVALIFYMVFALLTA